MGAWGYFAAAAIGVIVGAAELISRHTDRPLRSLAVGWGLFYLILNATFSILAMFVLDVLRPDWIEWPPIATEMLAVGSAPWLAAVAAAGFGAAAVFRSGIMKVRGAEGEVTVGPGAVVDVFLRMTDDAVDRTLGIWRISFVGGAMQNVDFNVAKTVLPPYCFAALRRLDAAQQADFARQLASLDTAAADNATKSELLGLSLVTLVGPDILKMAVIGLGDRITLPPDPPPPPPPAPAPTP